MIARNNQRPSVPGTRKREGAKNLPVATWNVRTLNGEGDLELLLAEMRRARVRVLGVAETHWRQDGDDVFVYWPDVVGAFGLGQCNDRRRMLLQFCAINNLMVCNTLFKHKECRRATWMSPNGETRAQIDYIIVRKTMRGLVNNCRVYNSFDIGSDHALLAAALKISTRKPNRQKVTKKFDVGRLMQNENLAEEFRTRIGGRFEPLLQEEDGTIEEIYASFRDITNLATKEIVGLKFVSLKLWV